MSDNNNNNNNLFENIVSSSALKPVMYNGLVNSSFDKKTVRLQLNSLIKVPKDLPSSSQLFIDVNEVTAYQGNFKTVAKASREYGIKGNPGSENIFAVSFSGKVTKDGDTKGFNFVFYRNGKIRFSGGFVGFDRDEDPSASEMTRQVEKIRKTIVDNFTRKNEFLMNKLEFNNVTGQLQIPGLIRDAQKAKLATLSSRIPHIKNTPGDVIFEKELMDNLYLYTKGGLTLVISTKGVIQLNGAKSPEELLKLYKSEVIDILQFMKDENIITTTDTFPIQMSKVPTAASKRLTNKPAPMLGKQTTTCPKGRRPDPYTMQGKCPRPGFYVKPNPQMQPCCYRIPQSTKYSRNKVENSYNTANVKVPRNVQVSFGIFKNTNNKKNDVTNKNLDSNNVYFSNDPKLGFKISGRQCGRFSKPALVNIASRLGIVNISRTTTVPELCKLISQKGKNLGLNLTNNIYGEMKVNVKLRGKDLPLFIHKKVLRIGGKVCTTYKKNELISMANSVNLEVTPEMNIKDLCGLLTSYLESKKSNIVRRRNEARAERIRQSNEAERRRVANQNRMKREEMNRIKIEHLSKIRMNPPQIKEDILNLLGKTFVAKYKDYLQPEVDRLSLNIMKDFINGITNKSIELYEYKGVMVPYKSDTDDLKKESVGLFKMSREPVLLKKFYMDKLKLVIPDEIKKYSNTYKINKDITNKAIEFLADYGSSRGADGKFIPYTKFKSALNAYIDVRFIKK